MTRLSEKLRLSLFLYKPTRFLSLNLLPNLSLSSTLHLCKSLARALASKTLAFFSSSSSAMDDPYWDLDFRPSFRSQRLRLHDDYDDDCSNDDVSHNAVDKLYLVPYRWWKEVRTEYDQMGGVLYTASTDDDAGSEIFLNLKKKDVAEEGFSGREYALVPEPTWCRALRRHNDFYTAAKDNVSLFGAEIFLKDVFSLQIRLFVSWETNSLVVKISQKDNTVDSYKRACNIFSSEYVPLHIWDFSGQTTQIFMNDSINLPNDIPGQLNKEILLELRLHGFSDYMKGRDWRSDEVADKHPSMDSSTYGGSMKMNGSTDYVNPYLTPTNSLQSGTIYRGAGSLGLIGLENLGNTCFMNSAIQCLVHTPKLVDYFLGDYRKDINYSNPLGMKGELALAFGELLRKLWAPGAKPVAPRMFKLKLASFAPQFSGYNQHDSQELLAFLLDGLHEDLNRVKCKPYIEAQDVEGRPDEEVAEEYWQNHLARNDSIIVDVCQGQYRSKLVCPVCNKVSVTFDPFMYLSLPLPSTTMRTMTLTVLSTDGTALPCTFTVTVPKSGRSLDLTNALSAACSLRDDETLMLAEVYKCRIFRLLEDPFDSLDLIRDGDRLVAYRLPKGCETSLLVTFIHQQMDMCHNNGEMRLVPQVFGIPLVATLPDVCNGSDIRNAFLKVLNPYLMSPGDLLNIFDDDFANEDSNATTTTTTTIMDNDADSDRESRDEANSDTDFQFYLPDAKEAIEDTLIDMNEPIVVSGLPKRLEVLVLWSDNMTKKYDTCLLNTLPEVFKPQFFMREPEESVSLYKCLKAFMKEEPLGPEDMWYCPICKKPQQASKKLDLWRLPEILVIHLKRFSYSNLFKNKLETFVDFPIYDLDFSPYISHRNSQLSCQYMLYAISNHYGGMGGGHYTAFVHLGNGLWYEFDDEKVLAVGQERIRTSAAYVLFYRRVPDI
ncbi:unnamed protein product [Prunus armeniaca]|uniref:Ubiquitin carboxyl-terminal hydrolase n=1 Tax=Prunus armeniaca TaxID=36596 RepID=A0A6J5VFT0_PRUAR|nr:unnamed protein product [Prunus armeniaca]